MSNLLYQFQKFQFQSNTKRLLRLYRKISGMLRNNEALPRVLERIWIAASFNGTKPDNIQAVAMREWRQTLQRGLNLTDAMEGWVPSRHLMVLRAGEEAGALAKALESIEEIEQSAKKMKGAIAKAINYPIFLFFLLYAILWGLGAQLVSQIRQYAPPGVQMKIKDLGDVTDFVMNYGHFVILGIALFLGVIVWSLPRWTGQLRKSFDKLIPYSWYRVWNGSSFLMGLSALIEAQTALSRALTILESQSSPWLRERISSTREEVMRGKNLGEALQAAGYEFPDKLIVFDMIILAERADVSKMLEMVSREWMEDQIELLEVQGAVVKNVFLALLAAVIAWAFGSIMSIAQGVSDSPGGAGF